eukprot:5098968-Pleurochrysis_carterae.AAC.4
MPCKVILHARRSAEVTATALNTGPAIVKCPDEHVLARAATVHDNWFREVIPARPERPSTQL